MKYKYKSKQEKSTSLQGTLEKKETTHYFDLGSGFIRVFLSIVARWKDSNSVGVDDGEDSHDNGETS